LSQQKSRSPKRALLTRSFGAAALPVGPSLDLRRSFAGSADRPPLYKGRANSLARKKRCRINRKICIAQFLGDER
jgi:hypothetical protein